jgi:hypothetical protein
MSGAELMQLFKDAGVSQTGKAFIDRIPIAVFFGQQSPLRAGARNPKYGREEAAALPLLAARAQERHEPGRELPIK